MMKDISQGPKNCDVCGAKYEYNKLGFYTHACASGAPPVLISTPSRKKEVDVRPAHDSKAQTDYVKTNIGVDRRVVELTAKIEQLEGMLNERQCAVCDARRLKANAAKRRYRGKAK